MRFVKRLVAATNKKNHLPLLIFESLLGKVWHRHRLAAVFINNEEEEVSACSLIWEAPYRIFLGTASTNQKRSTVWKVSKYGVFSGPYFSVFSPTTSW